MRNKLFIILLIITIINFGFRIFIYRESYLGKFDERYWSKRYEMSQWSTTKACGNPDPHINPHTCVWDDNWIAKNKFADQELIKKSTLGDDGLYAYSGWQYIQGTDPSLLNAETPPLGKYLIGLSIIAFGNQNIFSLISGIVSLLALYFLNMRITKNRFLSLLPVTFFSFEPLFYTQLRSTYLDLLYFAFLVFTFLFLLKKKYFLSAVFLGLMASTKASLSTFILVITSSIIFLLQKNFLRSSEDKQFSEIKKYLFNLPAAFVIFLLSYTVFFLNGNNIIKFLGVQKWIYNFYANGAKANISSVWEAIFTGKYPTWFGTVENVSEWHIGWLILFAFVIIETYTYIKKRKFDQKSLLLIWVLIYLAFLSFVPFWPRYLLLILPFMYNLFVWRVAKGIQNIRSIQGTKGK